MSLSKRPLPLPLVFYRLEANMPFNRKYAPKFVNRLLFINKEPLALRTKYMKTVSNLACPHSWSKNENKMKSLTRKITKRFKKHCRGNQYLNPKILSSFSSLKLCQLTNVFHIPLYFRLGRFPKLLLSYNTIPRKRSFPRNPLEVSHQISKITSIIKRSKHLKNLTPCGQNISILRSSKFQFLDANKEIILWK